MGRVTDFDNVGTSVGVVVGVMVIVRDNNPVKLLLGDIENECDAIRVVDTEMVSLAVVESDLLSVDERLAVVERVGLREDVLA